MRAAIVLSLAASLAILASGVEAQESKLSIIRAGGLIDGLGKATRRDVIIVIRDQRIAEIRDATHNDSSNPQVRDLSGYFVLPGLIDVHSHVTLSHDPKLDYGDLSAASNGILGVVHAKRTLMAGFTTVRVPGGPYYADVALRDAINAGWVEGPRMFVSGPVLTMTGGHGATGNWAPPGVEVRSAAGTVVDGVDAVLREVRLHQKFGVDFIKVMATGGIFTARSDPGAASFTREEIEAAVDEARKRGQRVAAHAHGLEGIRNAVLAGVHSIEHGSFLDAETIRLMVERGTYLVPDVYADEYALVFGDEIGLDPEMLEKARAVSGRFRESARRAHEAGVKIAFGTDAGVCPHGENAKQFRLYVDLGMSPTEAIATATRNAAELIGVTDDLGTIEVGKYADLVAVPRNPLEDVRVLETIPFVMKGGQIVKDETNRQNATDQRQAADGAERRR
jgi:imidazolonepropionase-like amidohydrolase